MIIDMDSIVVRDRQRTSMTPAQLHELAESILAVGNLHPPVCYPEDGKWILVAGERRVTAIKSLHKQGKEYRCGITLVPVGKLYITNLEDMTKEMAFEAELNENIHRVDLTWQDKARALAALHEMRSKQNPTQTKTKTAEELVKNNPNFTSTSSARGALNKATIIVKHLDNEKIAKARNEAEAMNLIYKQQYERVTAALIRRMARDDNVKLPVEIHHADLTLHTLTLPDNTFDLVVADPPYGIGAGGGGFRQRTVHHHNYTDTREEAQRLSQHIISEAFRVTKVRSNLLLFCDIDLFVWLKECCQRAGWTVFRRPLIWQKSESEGLAPWGSTGPRITTEFILLATKGARGFNSSPTDVFSVKRVPRHERIHPAEKPVELLKTLIELATLPGDSVLDPCCGSGSSLIAAKELRRSAVGIEKDPDYFNTAMANVFGKDVQSA